MANIQKQTPFILFEMSASPNKVKVFNNKVTDMFESANFEMIEQVRMEELGDKIESNYQSISKDQINELLG